MNTPAEAEQLDVTRFLVFGFVLIGLFSFLYYLYSDVFVHIVGLEEAFETAGVYLVIGVALSVIAIYVRRYKKNMFTRSLVVLSASMVIGALLSFFTSLFSLVGAGGDILSILIPEGIWYSENDAGVLLFFTVIFFIYFGYFGLSWLISWWLLPLYRYLSQGKIIHSLLAAFLAIIVWPFFSLITTALSYYLG